LGTGQISWILVGPQKRGLSTTEVAGTGRSPNPTMGSVPNPECPSKGACSQTGISLIVYPILLNRKPSAYDRKTRRRMRTMKMNPKLLMVALGGRSRTKGREDGLLEARFWGQVRYRSIVRNRLAIGIPVGADLIGDRSSPGSSCENWFTIQQQGSPTNPTLQQGSVPNRETDLRNPPTKGLSPIVVS
jgi:hypothetical protein